MTAPTKTEPAKTEPAITAPATTGPAGHLGDRSACALASRVATQILDVFAGRRSLRQVRDRLSGPVASLLAAKLSRPPRRRGDEQLGSYRLGSVHACVATTHKVEACAIVGTRERARAIVMRLEQTDTRWCCTMFSVL